MVAFWCCSCFIADSFARNPPLADSPMARGHLLSWSRTTESKRLDCSLSADRPPPFSGVQGKVRLLQVIRSVGLSGPKLVDC